MGAEPQSFILASFTSDSAQVTAQSDCRVGSFYLARRPVPRFFLGPFSGVHPFSLPGPSGTSKQDLTSFNMELSSSGISADLSRVSGGPEAGEGATGGDGMGTWLSLLVSSLGRAVASWGRSEPRTGLGAFWT